MIFSNPYPNLELKDLPIFINLLFTQFPNKRIFCLYGDLGAGKTTISKEIIRNLTAITTVTSPTFNIVQTYSGLGNFVYHYDLFRLKHESELYEIGLCDNLENNYNIIEWPELAENLLCGINRLNLKILTNEDDTRYIEILDFI